MIRTILQTNSAPGIKTVLAVDNMYLKLAYDNSPSLEEFKVTDMIWFLLLADNLTAGIIAMEPLNNILWSPHVFIFKKYRGKGSEEWGQQVAQYMKDKCGAKKFMAFTPYLIAKKYAENVGFKYIYTLTKSIKKSGKLLDQYILEM